MNLQDTIVAPATGNIISALGIVRISGDKAIEIACNIFSPNNNRKLSDILKANKLYYGSIKEDNRIIDEVVLSVFISPNSFTGEDVVEISHHGSPYIQQEIIRLIISKGARLADKGEFSMRSFLNGKMNLSQTEAIADLIQSNNSTSHLLAMKQLRGNYNEELKILRQRFLKIASLLELEIDFSAEQEVFVDRNELREELEKTSKSLEELTNSFKQGNSFKNGLPVAIVGKPNSGKSTLMNAILNDERSIVSSIEGTTRDTIEEVININGIQVRFIDTAGIRNSDNEIEKEGIRRSLLAIEKAQVVLYLVDSSTENIDSIQQQLQEINQEVYSKEKEIILVASKSDISTLSKQDIETLSQLNAVFICAKEKKGLDKLWERITQNMNIEDLNSKVFVCNERHYNALMNALIDVNLALVSLESGADADIISFNIRRATENIGNITGEICNDDILSNIFSKFCIGK